MTETLSDSNAFTSPIVVPNDAELANKASLKDLFVQALANRTYYLKQILEATGVTKLRAGDVAAMQALTGMVNGSLFLVENQGLYVYFAGSGIGVVDKFVYTTTVGGTSRWIHVLYGLANATIGLPVIGAVGANAGRILHTVVPMRVAVTGQNGDADADPAQTTTSGTMVDHTTSAMNLTLETNDIVLVDYVHRLTAVAGDVAEMEVGWIPPGGAFTVLRTVPLIGSATRDADIFTFCERVVAAGPGGATFKVRFRRFSGTTNVVSCKGTLRVTHIRP